MDPDNLQPPATRGTGMSLSQVQMWVMSVLAVTTILHFAAGLVAAAFQVEEERLDARIGLLVIAGIIGVLAVLAGAALHRKPLVSWWLLLGVLPALAGAYLMFWA
jgi:type III secretory pathway component EscS